MDHMDWIGLSVLVYAIVQGVVTIMAAIQSWRNGRDIAKVQHKVNGVTQQLVEQARYTGVLEGTVDQLRAHVQPPPSGIQAPAPTPPPEGQGTEEQ